MTRPFSTGFTILGFLAAILFATNAQAGSWGSSGGSWGSHGSSGGSHGSWGSYGSSGGSYGSYGGSYGSSGGSYGSSGGSYGSYGSHGSYGSYGSSGGSYGSSGGWSYGGGGVYSAPGGMPASPSDAPAAGDAPPAGDGTLPTPAASYQRRSAILTVNVPQDAKIYVNGQSTRSTGTTRSYISNDLMRGASYRYLVRAELEIDGQMVEQEKTIDLRAGDRQTVAFDLRQPNPVTTLTVNVPEDARVTLGGNEANAAGEVRMFATQQLGPGEKWDNYRVVVSVERDGQELSKAQSISLSAGDSRELNFSFDDNQVASSR